MMVAGRAARSIVLSLVGVALLAGAACTRRASVPPAPTVASAERVPAPDPEPAARETAGEVPAPDQPAAPEAPPLLPVPDPAGRLDIPPYDPPVPIPEPLPEEVDEPAEEEIEASPLDELAAVELYTLEVDPDLEETVSADLRESSFDIPVVLNHSVLQFLNYYQGRGRRIMEEGLRRSGRYLDYFAEVFEREQVPRDLIYLPHIESLFKPRAYSRAHARGLWQFVAGTGRRYGLEIDWWIDERSHVEKSTVAAARHLRDLYDEFGDWYLVLTAYNSGPGRVRRVHRRHGDLDYWEMRSRRLIPRETRNYVPSFLAALIIFKHPEKYGFHVEPEQPVALDRVPLDFQVDLRVVAELLDMKPQEVLDLNPQLRRGVTPYQRPGFELAVPEGTGDRLAAQLETLPEEKRLKVQHYRVRRGDTLSQIAGRFGSSVRAIADMNRIRNVHRLRLGQDLLIPSAGWRAPTRSARASRSRSGSYVVRRGDSLYRIARRLGLTVSQLATWNNIRPSQTIFPGQRLRLAPASAGLEQ